jgi:hypothetical protein
MGLCLEEVFHGSNLQRASEPYWISLPSTGEVSASSYSCVRAPFLVPSPAFIVKGDQKDNEHSPEVPEGQSLPAALRRAQTGEQLVEPQPMGLYLNYVKNFTNTLLELRTCQP